MKTILEFFLQSRLIYARAEKIALNPERAAKSKGYGISSIIFSILAIGGAVGFPFLCYSLFVLGTTTYLAIIGNIFVILLAIMLLFVPIYFAIFAVIFARAQRKVNQSKLTTVSKHLARISLLLSIALLVVVVVYLVNLNQTSN